MLTAILGASGAGKTTLLRVIAGFDAADEGTVTLGGMIVDGKRGRVPPERRQSATCRRTGRCSRT